MAKEQAGQDAKAVGERGRSRAAGPTKPNAFARMAQSIRSKCERITLPALDVRTFAWGLVVLIILCFVIRNWAPVRINLFGWYVDAPRAVVFVIIFLLGMLTGWLMEVRSRRTAEVEAAEATEAEAEQPAEGEDVEPEVSEEMPELENEDEPVSAEDFDDDEALI